MGSPEKESPLIPDALAGGRKSEGDEYTRFGDRVQRYGSARSRSQQMLFHLREHHVQLEHEISRLRDCGEYLVFNHYYTVSKVRLVGANFCMQHMICPLCAIRRGAKNVKAYLDRLQIIQAENPRLRPYLVTFTVKNGADLLERFEHLHNSLSILHRRRRQWFTKGRGWTESARAHGAVWSYEVTNKGNGWHPHVHAVWLCEEEPDQQALRSEWQRITKDSFMVDVRPITGDPAEGFVEVFKYALKFSELSLPDNVDAWQKLRGRRLLASFGSFRGVEVPEDLTDEKLENLPFIQLFYRYLPDSGYTLASAKPSDEL